MACLTLKIGQIERSSLSLTPVTPLTVKVKDTEHVGMAMVVTGGSTLSLGQPPQPASISLTPVAGLKLIMGEVCSVSSGSFVVLAASDGPLRTKDGGYFLLNPATNPPEN